MTGLKCKCGAVARFEWRKRRSGFSERIVCPECGATTPWQAGGRNGEHRAGLAREFQARARGEV